MEKSFHRAPRWCAVYAAVFAAMLNVCSGCANSASKPVDRASAAATGTLAKNPPKVRFPKPENVRGIYLTAWSAGSTRKMDKVVPMIDRTLLNAVVIDVRDDGLNYWKNDIATSKAVKANRTAVFKPDKVMERLEKHKVYPIARIACFRDQVMPESMPNRAVQDSRGGVWKDRSGHTWLDPYNKRNWEYIGEVVDHALDLGFPEIQLDYVRFPSEGKASAMVFPALSSYPDRNAKPTEVVAAFADFIKKRVHDRKAVLSADIFGIVSSGGGDQGIGQELNQISAPFDLVCPMVYPSHFAKGEYGIADPDSSPHAIVRRSLADFASKLPGKPIRPWLQDFSLYKVYGVKEVQAQIKAAKEAGYESYLLWNARNQYTEAAVAKPKK